MYNNFYNYIMYTYRTIIRTRICFVVILNHKRVIFFYHDKQRLGYIQKYFIYLKYFLFYFNFFLQNVNQHVIGVKSIINSSTYFEDLVFTLLTL